MNQLKQTQFLEYMNTRIEQLKSAHEKFKLLENEAISRDKIQVADLYNTQAASLWDRKIEMLETRIFFEQLCENTVAANMVNDFEKDPQKEFLEKFHDLVEKENDSIISASNDDIDEKVGLLIPGVGIVTLKELKKHNFEQVRGNFPDMMEVSPLDFYIPKKRILSQLNRQLTNHPLMQKPIPTVPARATAERPLTEKEKDFYQVMEQHYKERMSALLKVGKRSLPVYCKST